MNAVVVPPTFVERHPIGTGLALIALAFVLALVAGFGWRLANYRGDPQVTTVPVQLPGAAYTPAGPVTVPAALEPVRSLAPVQDPIPGNCTMTLNGMLYHDFGPVGPAFTPRDCAAAKAKKAQEDGLTVSGR